MEDWLIRRGVITGTLTFWNILTPFMASFRAMSWGVDTMTVPKAMS